MKFRWPKRRHRLTRRGLELRQATTADVDTLSDLYESCMRPYAEAFYPWDTHRFRDDFNPAEIEVLAFQDAIIGLLRTKVSEEFVYLAEVQIRATTRPGSFTRGSAFNRSRKAPAISFSNDRLPELEKTPAKGLRLPPFALKSCLRAPRI